MTPKLIGERSSRLGPRAEAIGEAATGEHSIRSDEGEGDDWTSVRAGDSSGRAVWVVPLTGVAYVVGSLCCYCTLERAMEALNMGEADVLLKLESIEMPLQCRICVLEES